MKCIGIDLGGTQLRAGLVNDDLLSDVTAIKVSSSGTEKEVLKEVFQVTDALMQKEVDAIGIGVPSVVNKEDGIVYDVQNIPSWKEVTLKEYMEDRYDVPVFIDNDANCFALGEKYFGKGKGCRSFIALTVGTGVGAGIVINDRLYSGFNCGAGELGMVEYKGSCYEYYASGQFFKNHYCICGEAVFNQAEAGNKKAIGILEEFGRHLGRLIKMILYAYDPKYIFIGGSVKEAYSYYQAAMWEEIGKYAYPKSLDNIIIEVSTLEHSSIFGAAALCYDQIDNTFKKD